MWHRQLKLAGRSTLPRHRSLTHRLTHPLITHKFYYGQGCNLSLSLTKRTYQLTFQTIWQDYLLLQLSGLTGLKDYLMSESGKNCVVSDQDLEDLPQEKINLRLKMPEDFSYQAEVKGRVRHVDGEVVGSRVRGFAVGVRMVGEGSEFQGRNITAESIEVSSEKITLGQILAATATFSCQHFHCTKLSISKTLTLNSTKTSNIRSLILQDSKAELDVADCQVESIMGKAKIRSRGSLEVKRWYGGGREDVEVEMVEEGIQGVKGVKGRGKVNVETGGGWVKGEGSQVTLGRMHTGRVVEDRESKMKRIEPGTQAPTQRKMFI